MEWKDPPKIEGRGGSRPPAYGSEALDELRANPNRWAHLHTYASRGGAAGAQKSLTRGKVKGTRPGEFEATVRQNGNGSDLYARFIDPDEPDWDESA